MRKILSILKKRSNRCTGIALGSSEVKLVELFCKNTPVLTSLRSVPFSTRCFSEEGEIVNADVLAEALKELTKGTEAEKNDVVTAVYGSGAVTRQILMPVMPEDELKSAVRWEAESYIPYALEEVELDYINLGEVQSGETNQLNIMIVAAPKSLVWQYYDVFTRSGLNLSAVEVEPIALSRLLPAEYFNGEDSTAVIDLGREHTNIVVLIRGRISFARILTMGLNKALSGISSGEVRGIEEDLSDIINEIERSLGYFRVQNRGDTVDRLVLSGEGAEIDDIEQVFHSNFNLPVDIIDLNTFFSGVKNQQEQALRPEFGIAAGLALRGVVVSV